MDAFDIVNPTGPLRTTTYTSGTGTHIFLNSTVLTRVTMCGGGGGGGTNTAAVMSGGTGAATIQVMMRFNVPSINYTVGAAGVGRNAATTLAGGDGGLSRFGGLVAPGGTGGLSSGNLSSGAYVGNYLSSVTTAVTPVSGVGLGIAGGCNSDGLNLLNCAANFPAQNGGTTTAKNASNIAANGGGDSALGTCGYSTTPPTGYGAGGYGCAAANGASSAGTGGIIIVEEFA